MTASAASSTTVNVEVIPAELCSHRQWVVWRYGPPRSDGKRPKQPCSPQSGMLAKTNDPGTWGTFDEALAQYEAGNYDGIGFVVRSEDPYVGVDLDGCRDAETGELRAWARRIIERLNTYSEVSPSGSGVRLWLCGIKPGTTCKRKLSETEQIEVYHHARFFTVTGHHLPGTPSSIEDRQTALDGWYADVFPRATPGSPVHPDEPSEPVDVDDAVLLERARSGKNGARFQRLWVGDTSDYHSDPSQADMALCGILAFYTGSDADRMDRLFRQSGLYREKWERSDYRERTIQHAITNASNTYRPTSRGSSRGPVQRISHVYDWQHHSETTYQRNRLLAQVAEDAREQVRAHFQAGSTTPLVIALPPGVGKSHAIADLGRTFDVAWISERHDMRESVVGLQSYYRPIIGCNADNCPEFHRHEALVAKGRNTWPLHKAHMCDYYAQHTEEGSAVYQIAHVQTAYPKKHEAIVTDELNLSSYLPVHSIGYNTMQAVLASPDTEPWADRLVRALREVVTRAHRDGAALHGKAVFDALNTELGGGSQLRALLVHLQTTDPQAFQTRPAAPVDLSLDEIMALPPVVVPYLLRALVAELPKWQQGGEWNSCIQVSPGPHGWELQIIEPRQFPLEEGETLPPWAILDATADAGFLERLLGMPVQLVRKEVPPPPHSRHIAVRTGKRYGKVSLVDAKHREDERRRVVQELRFLLREIDPNGTQQQAGKVGLITFKGAVEPLGDALDISGDRRGHFWAMRGSNTLADCTILLVVGTPTPNLTIVETWARALYRDDPDPITTDRDPDELGHEQYRDARLRSLVDYLIHAELTQCAHRNRPLRHDRRTVVTLCQGEVGYVPVTETITAFPRLTDEGMLYALEKSARDEEKLETAAWQLEEEGTPLTVRGLAGLAHVGHGTTSAWLRQRRDLAPHPRVADSA